MIYNVSGVQQSDSAVHICTYIIFQILFYYRLSQDILCYTVGSFFKRCIFYCEHFQILLEIKSIWIKINML